MHKSSKSTERFFLSVSSRMSLGAISDSKAISETTMDVSMESKPPTQQKTGTVLSGYTVITKSMIGAGTPH